jgi:uncharacterized protein YecE (DUF72 family)
VAHIRALAGRVDVSDLFVIFNNHFRGFSPGDAVELKSTLGLPQRPLPHQRTLDSFLD